MRYQPWADESLAANGRPIKDNFADWFASSKITSSSGEPLIVYHGGTVDIQTFKTPAYFTDFDEEATEYATGLMNPRPNGLSASGVVYPVYISIQRPFEMDAFDQGKLSLTKVKRLQNDGYDGVMGEGTYGNLHYIVFHPNQIKSATGNSGLYLTGSSSITDHVQALTIRCANEARDVVDKAVSKTKELQP